MLITSIYEVFVFYEQDDASNYTSYSNAAWNYPDYVQNLGIFGVFMSTMAISLSPICINLCTHYHNSFSICTSYIFIYTTLQFLPMWWHWFVGLLEPEQINSDILNTTCFYSSGCNTEYAFSWQLPHYNNPKLLQ